MMIPQATAHEVHVVLPVGVSPVGPPQLNRVLARRPQYRAGRISHVDIAPREEPKTLEQSRHAHRGKFRCDRIRTLTCDITRQNTAQRQPRPLCPEPQRRGEQQLPEPLTTPRLGHSDRTDDQRPRHTWWNSLLQVWVQASGLVIGDALSRILPSPIARVAAHRRVSHVDHIEGEVGDMPEYLAARDELIHVSRHPPVLDAVPSARLPPRLTVPKAQLYGEWSGG